MIQKGKGKGERVGKALSATTIQRRALFSRFINDNNYNEKTYSAYLSSLKVNDEVYSKTGFYKAINTSRRLANATAKL